MAAFGGTMAHRPAPTFAQPFAVHEVPVVEATPETLKGYGRIETDFPSARIEITRWPQQGWRPIDEVLYGRNDAVGDSYLIGWSRNPVEASETAAAPERARVLVWHANYHPDGGQLFFPRQHIPYIVPLALPGDDIAPEKFVGFYCDGSVGIYFHPGVWHTPALPLAPAADFDDRQGRVHARVSCNFVEEFGGYLSVPLRRP
jgi:ureidoglycolate lyase